MELDQDFERLTTAASAAVVYVLIRLPDAMSDDEQAVMAAVAAHRAALSANGGHGGPTVDRAVLAALGCLTG